VITRAWNFEPLLGTFWGEVLRQAGRTPLWGERCAAARRSLERSWGCHNLEVPVSRLSRTEPFAWVASHLVAEAPRFHAIYNQCVRTYRRENGIHSRNHPVPDLAEEDGWLELPFWAWRAGDQRRGRLFARANASDVELRVGKEVVRWWGGEVVAPPHHPTTSPPHHLVAAWLE